MGIRRFDQSIIEVGSKRCKKCRLLKPVGEFRKAQRNADGKDVWCRSCRMKLSREDAERMRGNWAEKEPSIEGTKRCGTCHEVKPRTEFHRNLTRADGFTGSCKACVASKSKSRYKGKRRLRVVFTGIRRRSRLSGLPFEMTFDEFCRWDAAHGPIKQRKCLICKSTISESKRFQRLRGTPLLYGFSVDRIDSKQGYRIGNIQQICYICNTIKSSWFTTQDMQLLGPDLGLIQRRALGLEE